MDLEAEEVLAEKLMYALPSGDAGIARRRKIVKQVNQNGVRQTFQAGDQIIIPLSSNGNAIDPEGFRVNFLLRTSGVNGAETNYLPIGGHGLIQRLRILGHGGVVLEDLPDYNVFAGTIIPYIYKQDFYDKHGDLEAFPPFMKSASAVAGEGLTQSQQTDAYTFAGAVQADTGVSDMSVGPLAEWRIQTARLNQSTGGLYVSLPLRFSGIFGGKKLIPAHLMGQLQLEITLAPYEDAFTQSTVNGETWNTGDMKVTAPSDETEIWPSADSAQTTLPTYTITEVEAVFPTVTLAAKMNESLEKVVNGEGLPFHFPTYAVAKKPIAASEAGEGTHSISRNTSNAIAVLLAIRDTPGAGTTNTQLTRQIANRSFDTWQKGIRRWQVQLGTTSYPDFRVEHAHETLPLTLEAIPYHYRDAEKPSLGLQKFSWENQMGNLRKAATGTMIMPLDYAYEAGHEGKAMEACVGNPEWGPRHYVIGYNFETTPGMELSARSTVSGVNPQVHYYQDNSLTFSELAAERFQTAGMMYLWLIYTRILMIMAGGNVVLKE